MNARLALSIFTLLIFGVLASCQKAPSANDKIVAQGDMKAQIGKFTLSGDGLCIGRDSGDAVSEECETPGTFKGGTILFVGVTIEKAQYLDLEKHAAAALAVD